ncbi:hypothetical protein B4U79_00244 [Dinothrombium tinctorium]|uniref:Chitin-binding type-2 domain-containing protein n=1 Tax=Dinothrombium tinctorium TaxID=1965070 RepID=A0A3S3P540_9ACAR|nr:hypothetical protein B4U79_00244 [Dinothrombium tinctorium]
MTSFKSLLIIFLICSIDARNFLNDRVPKELSDQRQSHSQANQYAVKSEPDNFMHYGNFASRRTYYTDPANQYHPYERLQSQWLHSNYYSAWRGARRWYGQNYPTYSNIPNTGFKCARLAHGGYYADVSSGCQVYHVCQRDGRQDAFLCPNGTLFNQKLLTCDFWNLVDCSTSPSYYYLNERIGVLPPLPATLYRYE